MLFEDLRVLKSKFCESHFSKLKVVIQSSQHTTNNFFMRIAQNQGVYLQKCKYRHIFRVKFCRVFGLKKVDLRFKSFFKLLFFF